MEEEERVSSLAEAVLAGPGGGNISHVVPKGEARVPRTRSGLVSTRRVLAPRGFCTTFSTPVSPLPGLGTGSLVRVSHIQ